MHQHKIMVKTGNTDARIVRGRTSRFCDPLGWKKKTGPRRRGAGSQWPASRRVAAAKIRAIGGRAVTGEETQAGDGAIAGNPSMGAVKAENDGRLWTLSEAARRSPAGACLG